MSDIAFLQTVRAWRTPAAVRVRSRLSLSELAATVFFAYITLAALMHPMAGQDTGIIMLLNCVTVSTLIALRQNRDRARWLMAAADLFPVLLILIAYRESGWLLTPDSSHHLDFVFIGWDRRLLQNRFVEAVLQAGAPWLQRYLELAYLLCYPLVPLGVAAVHLAIQRSPENAPPSSWWHLPARCRLYARRIAHVFFGKFDPAQSMHAMEDFWATVLLSTLFCYAVYPLFPLTPPRVLFHDVPGPHVEPLLRRWNFWLLDHYSVQACIFPSGHVAAVTAVALAVRKRTPWFGGLFLFLAASVAFATVYGRYHYAADALAGALVGVAAFVAANAFACN